MTMLEHLLNAMIRITGAERGLAVTPAFEVLHTVNFDGDVKADADFWAFALQTFGKASESHEPVLTNNIITDPTQAPTTNTNFANLRVVVVFPVKQLGYLYIDQPVKRGAFTRQQVDRLRQVIEQIDVANETPLTEDAIQNLYENAP